MRSLTETQSAVTEDDIERIFNEIDSDGNGFLTPREAKKAHKKLSERFQIDRVISKDPSDYSICSFWYPKRFFVRYVNST